MSQKLHSRIIAMHQFLFKIPTRSINLGVMQSFKFQLVYPLFQSHRDKHAYVATQLPLPGTMYDFWNMCIDYKCKTILLFERETEDNLKVSNSMKINYDVID